MFLFKMGEDVSGQFPLMVLPVGSPCRFPCMLCGRVLLKQINLNSKQVLVAPSAFAVSLVLMV